eukprot:4063951-Amphidinium_carterae.1
MPVEFLLPRNALKDKLRCSCKTPSAPHLPTATHLLCQSPPGNGTVHTRANTHKTNAKKERMNTMNVSREQVVIKLKT